MEHIAALLLVIGCSDDLSQCRELSAPGSVFETMQACDEALPSSLGAFSAQFEAFYAQCLPVDPAMEEEDAQLVWKVRPYGSLVASVGAVAPDRNGSLLMAGSLLSSTTTMANTASSVGRP